MRRGTILTTAWLTVITNGTAITLAKVGVWRSSDGVLAASTADLSAQLVTGTVVRLQQAPLTTPYTVPADGFYYAGVLQVGTGLGTIQAVATQTPNAVPGGVTPYGAMISQSDLASFAPPLPNGALIPWIGFS
jgi:hypothetical protein